MPIGAMVCEEEMLYSAEETMEALFSQAFPHLHVGLPGTLSSVPKRVHVTYTAGPIVIENGD